MIPFTVTTTQSISLTAYKSVYIKGTAAGNTFTPISTTPLTQEEPTNEDGYAYLLLGTAYSATAMYLVMEHPVFVYTNGAFQSMASLASQASDQANSAKADAAQAQQTADSAQDTANDALTSAGAAQTTANEALAAANTAQGGLAALQLTAEQISTIVNGLSTDYSELQNYISTSANGELILAAHNSDFQVRISAAEIGFYNGTNKMAYFSGEQFVINKGTLITELNIDPFSWVKRANGHLSLIYKGSN